MKKFSQSEFNWRGALIGPTALLLFFLVSAQNAFSYGLGASSYPFPTDRSLFTTEFVGHLSNGGGPGIQARFLKKLTSSISVEGGLGFADGELARSFFASSDIEFYPDYERQPRIAIKALIENAKEYGSRRNIIGVSPIVSKGFKIDGREIFPFVSIPIGLTLDNSTKRYEVREHLALGATGKLPFQDYEQLVVNLEGDINLSNSSSGVFLGVSYPLNL